LSLRRKACFVNDYAGFRFFFFRHPAPVLTSFASFFFCRQAPVLASFAGFFFCRQAPVLTPITVPFPPASLRFRLSKKRRGESGCH